MKYLINKGTILSVAVLVVTMMAIGCARTPLQTEASTSGIRAAEEAGAAKVPQASLHLQLAKEELDSAKAFSEQGKKEQAVSMLARAEADAELAITLSRGDAERVEARAAMERVYQLRQENP